MGCLKLTYDQIFPLLKVTHSDFSAKEKTMNRFFISEEKSSARKYRYSFNGMEKDDEVKGNHLDFGARCYDSRLGRWLSLDAYATDYPSLSDYVFVANSPLMNIDPDGNKIIGVTFNPKTGQYSYTKAALKNGTKRYVEARMQSKSGKEAIHKIHSDSREVNIIVTDKMIVREGSKRFKGKPAKKL